MRVWEIVMQLWSDTVYEVVEVNESMVINRLVIVRVGTAMNNTDYPGIIRQLLIRVWPSFLTSSETILFCLCSLVGVGNSGFIGGVSGEPDVVDGVLLVGNLPPASISAAACSLLPVAALIFPVDIDDKPF